MRLRAVWAIPWLLAVFLSALSTQGSTAQEDNLLTNGGFEDGTAGWRAFGQGVLTTSGAFVRSGSSAGVFVTAAGRDDIRYCLPVMASADYQFQGHAARAEGDLASQLRLRVLWREEEDCFGDNQGTRDSPLVRLDEQNHWYELTVSARSPNTARWAYLTVEVQESGATVYLDDFTVSGPAAPTETPTPEPSAYPSPSASPASTPGPHGTPAPTATAEHRTPAPTATAYLSPTASSWERTPVPAQEALRNGSFEEEDPDGRPSFWRKYGGELARSGTVHFEGNFAAALRSETTSTKWVYQIVTVQGGKAYVLSGYALKNDPAVTQAYLRISWYASPDGSGQAIDIADSTERLLDDSPEFRLLTTGAVVAPAEAASAKARLMLDPVSEAPAAVYFDAVTFEETAPPAPALTPTATPSLQDEGEALAPSSPAPGESAQAPSSEPRDVSTPAGSATRPRSSSTAARATGSATPAVLGAARTPSATTTPAPTSTRAPAAVYRQRKSDRLAKDSAAAREASGEGDLSPLLLALAAAVPALAGVGAGVYYWRWRRARLR